MSTMEKDINLTEFQFDMLPSDERRLVLDNFVLLDDNLDSTQDLELGSHVNRQLFPLKLMFPLVIICKQGEMVAQLNLEDIRLEQNDVLIMVPGTIGEDVSVTKDCRVAIMAIPESAFPMLMKMEHSLKFREHFSHPLKFHYSDAEMEHIVMIYKLMRSIINMGSPYCKEILMNYMEAVAYFTITKLEAISNENVKKQRGDILFHQFMNEVRRYYTTERQLSFYADKLCITTKYLSRVVKQHSGRQPSEWVRDYVILEAKALLRQNELSVQQISDILNFPNPSFFGKYFKAVVGCSPRQYQLQKD
ncbi:MAG: AraC family transcriptional regulator [Bacteroidaceae bacterium]|nr:AraC family transcriptional regulator [Bacteroidaceae bacterium]